MCMCNRYFKYNQADLMCMYNWYLKFRQRHRLLFVGTFERMDGKPFSLLSCYYVRYLWWVIMMQIGYHNLSIYIYVYT